MQGPFGDRRDRGDKTARTLLAEEAVLRSLETEKRLAEDERSIDRLYKWAKYAVGLLVATVAGTLTVVATTSSIARKNDITSVNRRISEVAERVGDIEHKREIDRAELDRQSKRSEDVEKQLRDLTGKWLDDLRRRRR